MQSKTEEFTAQLEQYDIMHKRPRSFELYEEYRRCNIIETVRIRKGNYDKADTEAKRELTTEVEQEVENFCTWLIEVKNLEPTTAHYCSISLKSLLLGLPIGVQIAELFDVILNK